jgi:hypothetical protein
MKEFTRPALYNYLLKEQGKIQAALEEEDEGPNAEIRRGAWAMAQRIIEDLSVGRQRRVEAMKPNGKSRIGAASYGSTRETRSC